MNRVGVVGTGALGFHHARILGELPGGGCAGIHDTDAERAQWVARELGVRAFPSLEALLACSDAVVVSVPTDAHEAVAVAALEQGVHVLVEKPLAPTLEAADRMLAAADARGCVLQVGHVERFNPAVRAAEPYLEAPLFVESQRLAPFSPRSADVAVVLDLMIHDVDLVQVLVGCPVERVDAVGMAVLTPRVDIANARLAFRGGAVANLTASRVSLNRRRKLRIFQRAGYLSLDLAAGTGEFLRLRRDLPALSGEAFPGAWLPDAGRADPDVAAAPAGVEGLVDRIPLRGDGVEPLRLQLESFLRAVAGEAPPAVTGLQGRSALQLTLLIEERIRDHVAHTRTAQA
ncbi:MAG: Gfo/Idh/MocA family oxidoreductase [Longimicrobiales bacterium]|nr:Gfo/Idh/MocA family oxidoreductase [Longimicrobiales bacterium]